MSIVILFQDTGATIIEAVKVLEEHGVQEENIIFLNLFATPHGK
jgi:uracil phosphoribosyltransferase